MSKFLTKPNPGQATDSTDILAVRDILATVVSNSQGTNLVLLFAKCLLNGKQKVTYGIIISGRPLPLHGGGGGNLHFDIGTKDNHGMIQF